MSGALLVGMLLITAGASDPPVASASDVAEQRLNTIDVGGGVAVGTAGSGLSALVVLDWEKPVFVSQAFFVDFLLRADWRTYSTRGDASTLSGSYALNRFDVLAGLRLGAKLGKAFEFFFGFAAGAAGGWTRTATAFHGWWINDQLGVGFQAGVGVRLHLSERISLFLVPAELLGGFWPLGGLTGNTVTADFTSALGLGVSL